MGLPNVQNQDLNLVLSTDAKPRLKWTPELHQRFVDTVVQLGGATKATPKSLMKAMGIPGLTLYHLKSHLQKYRLGKNQPGEACTDFNQEDCKDNNKGGLDLFSEEAHDETHPINKSPKIARSVQVQRELNEQIEVQKHLQLRIEAQGKYLQKVLKKAQETLAAYTSSSMGVELVSSGCSSPSLSELTEARPLSLENLDHQIKIKGQSCSTESSLTSSETSGAKEDNEPILLALLDQPSVISHSSDQVLGRKRKGSPINCGEREATKKLSTYKENMGSGSNEIGLFGTLDLNNQYQEDQNMGQPTIDLNSIG